jgi:ATP-dependent RNA helicase RhlE
VNASVIDYGKQLPLKSTVVFGGVKIEQELEKWSNIITIYNFMH